LAGVAGSVARDREWADAGTRPAAARSRGFLARTFHGLTGRRLAVLALFGFVLSVFGGPVAITYARGLPASQIVFAFAQTCVGDAVWFFGGLLAALAAYNRTPGSISLRLCTAAAAIGVVLWYALPVWYFIRTAPLRDVFADSRTFEALRHETWLNYYLIVAIATAALLYMTHGDDVEQSLESEALRALDLDRGLDEARLQAMQAQIEPHFLFNTLANVRRLYQVDRDAARTMLRQFSLMLGRSLADIRNERATLGREVALALAYLGVQKIRMGDRLEFATDIPPPLRDAALPPMMLSTLVENSIKHGLAPLRGGGRVTIAADANGGTLRVRVVDTGCGLSESAGSGVGLANIQTRLAALYGAEGALSLEHNEQGGVTAILELPLRLEPAQTRDADAAD
jgi:signal transduction histidine kinase